MTRRLWRAVRYVLVAALAYDATVAVLRIVTDGEDTTREDHE